MIGQLLGFFLAIATIALGIKGFTSQGLPLTKTMNITGTPAKIIGSLCIAFGLLLLLAQLLFIMLYPARNAL